MEGDPSFIGINTSPETNIFNANTSSSSLDSPESNISNKSRYGRTRKPKVSQDFYDIDAIFEHPDIQEISPTTKPKRITSTKVTPKLTPSPVKIPKSPSPDFIHVTGDDVLDDAKKLVSKKKLIMSPSQTSPTVRKFFKRESANVEVKTPKAESLESEDVEKVLKIISVKANDLTPDGSESKSSLKTTVKTYGNRRKTSYKLPSIESFGLPDVPLFPIEKEKVGNAPKRIYNLDVPSTSSSNVNLDKQLLDMPWQSGFDFNGEEMNNRLYACDDLPVPESKISKSKKTPKLKITTVNRSIANIKNGNKAYNKTNSKVLKAKSNKKFDKLTTQLDQASTSKEAVKEWKVVDLTNRSKTKNVAVNNQSAIGRVVKSKIQKEMDSNKTPKKIKPVTNISEPVKMQEEVTRGKKKDKTWKVVDLSCPLSEKNENSQKPIKQQSKLKIIELVGSVIKDIGSKKLPKEKPQKSTKVNKSSRTSNKIPKDHSPKLISKSNVIDVTSPTLEEKVKVVEDKSVQIVNKNDESDESSSPSKSRRASKRNLVKTVVNEDLSTNLKRSPRLQKSKETVLNIKSSADSNDVELDLKSPKESDLEEKSKDVDKLEESSTNVAELPKIKKQKLVDTTIEVKRSPRLQKPVLDNKKPLGESSKTKTLPSKISQKRLRSPKKISNVDTVKKVEEVVAKTLPVENYSELDDLSLILQLEAAINSINEKPKSSNAAEEQVVKSSKETQDKNEEGVQISEKVSDKLSVNDVDNSTCSSSNEINSINETQPLCSEAKEVGFENVQKESEVGKTKKGGKKLLIKKKVKKQLFNFNKGKQTVPNIETVKGVEVISPLEAKNELNSSVSSEETQQTSPLAEQQGDTKPKSKRGRKKKQIVKGKSTAVSEMALKLKKKVNLIRSTSDNGVKAKKGLKNLFKSKAIVKLHRFDEAKLFKTKIKTRQMSNLRNVSNPKSKTKGLRKMVESSETEIHSSQDDDDEPGGALTTEPNVENQQVTSDSSDEPVKKRKRGRKKIHPNPFSFVQKNENQEPEVKEEAVTPDVQLPMELDESQDEIEIKVEKGAYQPGDLMWAKLGNFPYWPCIIHSEPLSKKHKRLVGKVRPKTMYHIRFFGDNGRRAWIPSGTIMPYTSKDDLDNIRLRLKNKALSQYYSVKPPLLKKWIVAVDEAELLKSSTAQERFDFFFEMFASKREKLERKRLASIVKVETTKEIKEEDDQNQELKQKATKSNNTIQENNKMKPLKLKLKTKKMKTKIRIKKQKLKKTKILKIKASKPIKMKSIKKKVKVEELKVEEKSPEDSNEPLPKVVLPDTEIHKRHLIQSLNDCNSDTSFSDSDTLSKSSANGPVSDMFKKEVARFKKCNIFKGITRERVCQVCHKPGDVIKCKGPCNGLFHINCANNLLVQNIKVKEEVKNLEETEKLVKVQTIKVEEFDLSKVDFNNVEIVQVDSDSDDPDYDNILIPAVPSVSTDDFKRMTLLEKIDLKMVEVMETFGEKTRYADSTTDYASSEDSTLNVNVGHVTADGVSFSSLNGTDSTNETIPKNNLNEEKKEVAASSSGSALDPTKDEFKCGFCSLGIDPPCFICQKQVLNDDDSVLQKCSLHMCRKFYHPVCVKQWPQTQWSLISTAKHKNSEKILDTFVCPMHVCHTCTSDNPHVAASRCTSDKVVRCLCCPATFHSTNYCVPAGSNILTSSQIICPKHFKKSTAVNTPWCLICSKGGELICCENCPTSVHANCLHINLLEDGTFVCDDCESGRFLLYDEIVWVKMRSFRWWPALILFPNEVPEKLLKMAHKEGDFAVRFFGSNNYFWANRRCSFLYHEGDNKTATKTKANLIFNKAIKEAAEAYQFKKVFKLKQEAEIQMGLKPPPYIKVKVNKPVGNVRQFDGNFSQFDGNVSNTTACECDPNNPNPCGPDGYCLNRLLLTECDPNVCPAKDKCNNQCFEKRQYPPLVAFKTASRGWGLKCTAQLHKGDFVIEYVGEVIDDQEYQRRINKMHEQKDENYYFLTIDKDRIIDAGPKGNLARFMNHCCQPNCETQKWTVNGDTRVGLFAMDDIAADTELTFNYNLECVGKEKKVCRCGAPNCSGFIGVKSKQDESHKKSKKNNSSKKKRKKQLLTPQIGNKSGGPCFVCGEIGDVAACHNKICTKYYHLQCVNLEMWPEGKWVCPWHNCNICTKRTIRCCVKCINSYCPVHSEGNVRYDKLLGFVCSDHDPTKESQDLSPTTINKSKSISLNTEETDVTSTTSDELDSQSSSNDLSSNTNTNSTLTDSIVLTPEESGEITQSGKPHSVNDGPKKETNLNGKRKKNKRKLSAGSKRLKLSNNSVSESYEKPKPSSTGVVDISIQNEVKLSASIPSRHLRTTRSNVNSNVEVKRFLKHQSEVEKGLPFRKRSQLRYESV